MKKFSLSNYNISRRSRRIALVALIISTFALLIFLGFLTRISLRKQLIEFTSQQIYMQIGTTADAALHLIDIEKKRVLGGSVAVPYSWAFNNTCGD